MNNYKEFIEEIYPLHRTIVSFDMYKTHEIIKKYVPKNVVYKLNKFQTGLDVFDWKIPKLYDVREAYFIELSTGERYADFNTNNLHLVSYSQKFNKEISYEELFGHLYYSDKIDDAIPWKFNYYNEHWGFCITKNDFVRLDKNSKFQVVIDSKFHDDYLLVGEVTIDGKTKDEIVILSDVCHPYQVDDSISGVVMALELMSILSQTENNYTYRFLFLPETIGSLAYLSHNEEKIQNMKYAFFSEMLGNSNQLSLQLSHQKNSRIDKAFSVLKDKYNIRIGEFQTIVKNDEIVFNSPGINIPSISVSRSKKVMDSFYGYHTSYDNPSNLIYGNIEEAIKYTTESIKILDSDFIPVPNFKGLIFYSKSFLWDKYCAKHGKKEEIDAIVFAINGHNNILDISQKTNIEYHFCNEFVNDLLQLNYIRKRDEV